MTVVVVMAQPPREGLVATGIAESTPLSTAEAADLYEALFRDAVLAVDRSGGELLVNYPVDDDLPAEHRTDTAPEAELRTLVADTLGGTGDARFERQVGSSFGARAGNTVAHLLREENAHSVAVVTPQAPLLSRTVIDSAAMKLRTNEVVLGPSTRGRTYYAGFTAPIDFDGAFEAPSLPTLAARGRDADRDVEFLESSPSMVDGADLLDAVPLLRARFAAERVVPDYTAAFVHEHGLDVVVEDGEERVVRD
ncbi:DUF2064 domain-containing protein [Halorubrum sp. Hd13]|uniref:DUF2064 domain-containing protein n=1 Tax=Halorubrum sp. Hd13 TaxID=1480728 RepID=UPI000B99B303|nr:DUF2064 domain-containing protein [Halorubrum sp. Hd13]OYR45410.1 hypothetical protein DJ81_04775 [Halorubrum sp. Hd13]